MYNYWEFILGEQTIMSMQAEKKNKKKFDFSVLFRHPICIINVVELKIIAYGIYIFQLNNTTNLD